MKKLLTHKTVTFLLSILCALYSFGQADCQCLKPFKNASEKIVVEYEQNKRIVICSNFKKRIGDKTFLEDFGVYECEKNKLLLKSEPNTSYELVSDAPPALVIRYENLPNKNDSLELQPFLRYKIFRTNKTIQLNPVLLYETPKLKKDKIELIKSEFYNKNEIEKKYAKKKDYAQKEYMLELFHCVMTGDMECKGIFDNLNSRMILDGETETLYKKMEGLMRIYFGMKKSENKNIKH